MYDEDQKEVQLFELILILINVFASRHLRRMIRIMRVKKLRMKLDWKPYNMNLILTHNIIPFQISHCAGPANNIRYDITERRL